MAHLLVAACSCINSLRSLQPLQVADKFVSQLPAAQVGWGGTEKLTNLFA